MDVGIKKPRHQGGKGDGNQTRMRGNLSYMKIITKEHLKMTMLTHEPSKVMIASKELMNLNEVKSMVLVEVKECLFYT